MRLLGICLCGLLLVGVTPAEARRKVKYRAPPPSEPAPPAPAPAANTQLDELAQPPTADEPTASVLARARKLYDLLEADRVLPVVDALLARPELTVDERIEAYVLKGSSLAVVSDPVDAEPPFRLLLRMSPDFDLGGDTPPKILAVFRKVQAEERLIVEQTAKMQRDRLVGTLALKGELPPEAQGGRALLFAYRLKDPSGAVDSVLVMFRKQGERTYSSLALERDDEGVWRGALTGEQTASEGGFQLEYVVETRDDKGVLLAEGAADKPLVLAVAPGAVDHSEPPPLPAWTFWTAVGSTTAVAAAGGGLALAAWWAREDYLAYATSGTVEDPADGTVLMSKADNGFAISLGRDVALVSAALLALATSTMAFFVDWQGRAPDEAG